LFEKERAAMSSNSSESETSERSHSWAAPLALAAGVVLLALGLYRANTDDSAAGDLESETI